MFRNRAQKLHFVGIGGIGMSGIAEVLSTLGYDVSGSDLAASAATERLERLGIVVFVGHAAQNVAGRDVVVVSSAIHADNPELQEARRLGVPVIRRAEMLAELMRLKYGIAVAGTHGKTTTTSLIAHILTAAGVDPTAVVGGRLKNMGSNARLGSGEYLVAEADESDGSFLHLVPTLAVVTNVDLEHLDHWRGGIGELTDAFVNFANKVPFYGAAVVCLDHPVVREMLPRLHKRVITYGLGPQAEYTAHKLRYTQLGTRFVVARAGTVLGEVELNLVGRHNVCNALCSIAVAIEVGVPFAAVARALGRFEGIGRRFEVKGERGGVLVVDDYGHHPAEVAVTLRAAREAHPERRLVVAFQPHRYSRTRDFFAEFAASFHDSHVLRLLDVYAAGEAPIAGVDGAALAERARGMGHRDAAYVGGVAEASAALAGVVRPGDLVLTLGAGNVWQAGEALLHHHLGG